MVLQSLEEGKCTSIQTRHKNVAFERVLSLGPNVVGKDKLSLAVGVGWRESNREGFLLFAV